MTHCNSLHGRMNKFCSMEQNCKSANKADFKARFFFSFACVKTHAGTKLKFIWVKIYHLALILSAVEFGLMSATVLVISVGCHSEESEGKCRDKPDPVAQWITARTSRAGIDVVGRLRRDMNRRKKALISVTMWLLFTKIWVFLTSFLVFFF